MVTLTAIVPATDHPSTLGRCLASIQAASEPPEQVIVVEEPAGAGPAEARNLGALSAEGDTLVFVDADVEVHEDAFSRIRARFSSDPELSGVFGSYDDDPEAQEVVSTFRNLLHHQVHQAGEGEASTFWAGLGAIKKTAFLAVGGFDETRFRRPAIEDIDLGLRLTALGHRILLDPAIQGKHLKAWTVRGMIITDVRDRGIPWVSLLLRTRSLPTSLNLGWRHRMSALASLVVIGALAKRRPGPAASGLLGLLVLNRQLYRTILARRGARAATLALPLHVIHHLISVLAVAGGVVAHLVEAIRGRAARRRPG